MSGIGKMNRGTLEIDLLDLVEHLSDDARTNLARYLVADKLLFRAVLECVADGSYHQDDTRGSWWFDAEATGELRAKLAPLMPEIAARLVAELMRERDQARLNEKRNWDWAWKLWHAWPEHLQCNRPALPREYEHARWYTEEDGQAAIDASEAQR